jgi:hypothetical protein
LVAFGEYFKTYATTGLKSLRQFAGRRPLRFLSRAMRAATNLS